MSSSLLERTVELLRNRPRTLTYADISRDTGLHIAWLKELLSNRTPSPGVVAVQKLYEYLSGRKLDV